MSAFKLSEIASPAASSAARLMREPDESFSNVEPRRLLVISKFRCALSAAWLVMILSDILFYLRYYKPAGTAPPSIVKDFFTITAKKTLLLLPVNGTAYYFFARKLLPAKLQKTYC
jgi:hypothetical protein